MNKKVLYGIIVVLVVVIAGVLLFSGHKVAQKENEVGEPTNALPGTTVPAPTPTDDKTMVDCGEAKDPSCFINRMNGCLPVTTKMIGSDNKTAIEITILGVENEKCHFERKINNVTDMNCLFSKGTLNTDTLGQMFGTDKGLQKVVDDACKNPTGNTGW